MFSKYKPFYKAGAMNMMAYKFNSISWFLISIIEWICVVFLWFSVYSSSQDGINGIINGFSFKDMIVYAIFSNIVSFTVFVDDTMSIIADEIADGTIALSFIKPISYRGRFVAQCLGTVSSQFIILGFPCLTLSTVIFLLCKSIPFSGIFPFIFNLILFFLTSFTGVIISNAINFFMGTICFYTTQAWGLRQIKEVVVGFLSGSMIPVSFFPGVFGKIVQIMPFAGLIQNPILILQGKLSYRECFIVLGKNILWIFIFELICAFMFNTASKKVTVQGG